MALVAGRTTEPRSVSLTKTSGSAAVTAAAGTFSALDVGRTVTGTGIPAGTTILSVQSATAATLSANATVTGAASAAFGPVDPATAGFSGWSPESLADAASYSVSAVNAGTVPPDRQVNSTTGIVQRWRN